MAPRVSRIALATALVLAGSAASPAGAQDGTDCAASVSPAAVFVGQQVLLSGSGFTPGAVPTLTWEGPEGTQRIDFAELAEVGGDRYRVRDDGTFGPLDLSSAPTGDETLEQYGGTTLLSLTDGSCTAETTYLSFAGLTWEPLDGLAGPGDEALLPGGVAVSDDGTSVVVAASADLLGAAAEGDRQDQARAWVSSDAETWEAIVLLADGDVIAMDVAWTPIGFLASGFAVPTGGDPVAHAWLSPDGRDWQAVDLAASANPVSGVLRPMATADGAALLGGDLERGPKRGKRRATEVLRPAVWSSTGGAAWTFERLGRSPGSAVAGALHLAEPWVLATEAKPRRTNLRTWRHDGVAWGRSGRGFRPRGSLEGPVSFADGAGQLFVTTDADARRSADGRRWRRVPELVGFAGALGGFGHGDAAVLALDEAAARVSFDGARWTELPTDAFAGHRVIDFAELPDGRILAVGQAYETSTLQAWLGRPGIG